MDVFDDLLNPRPTRRDDAEPTFAPSPALSVGVEEEFMLVDPQSGALVASAQQVREALGAPPRITYEVVQSTIEASTPPIGPARARDLEATLTGHRQQLATAAANAGCALASVGAHPFCDSATQRVTEGERYQGLISEYPWISRVSVTYGMHVHVGMSTGDDAIKVLNGIQQFLPEIVALSANSPFWGGRRTGLMSTRVPLTQLYPRTGLPPWFSGWDEYASAVASLVRSGAIADYSYLWWVVRPHSRFGTIEVRLCDAQTDVASAAAIAALVQAICAWIISDVRYQRREDVADRMAVEENLWLATRDGMGAQLLRLDGGGRWSAREAVEALLELVAPFMRDLGTDASLDVLARMAVRNGAARQLAVFERAADLREVVRDAAARTLPGGAGAAEQIPGSQAVARPD